MAGSTRPSTEQAGSVSATGDDDSGRLIADVVAATRANPALQPLDDRELRHVHHGQTAAMWTSVTVLMVGFVVGGVAMVIGPNWVLFAVACGICVLGIVAGLVLQKLGLGIYQKKQ